MITIDEVHSLAISKGWWRKDGNNNIPEKIAMVHSELSEALEEYRNGKDKLYFHPRTGKPEGLGIELADTVIRIMDLCGYLGVNLEEMIEIKYRYNKDRPYRHGNKKC